MAAWDRSLLLPSPTTPSARFSQDAMAGASARIWVEEVIGQSLPGEGFAEAFKDGQALCRLVNTLCGLGTIGKVETSSSPFKQMANISAFIQACRKLGVRDHSLFETLDLYNENSLPQVVRCLFSLSEVVRNTFPEFHGPYLSTPDKPEVDPAVKVIVDIAKGNIPAPGWGPMTPNRGGGRSNGVSGGGDGAGFGSRVLRLTLPKDAKQENGVGCLSPAAHAVGHLTYGIYEGGGAVFSPGAVGSSGGKGSVGSPVNSGLGTGVGVPKPGTVEALVAQRLVDDGCRGGNQKSPDRNGNDQDNGNGGDGGDGIEEFTGSTRPLLNTPRRMPMTPGNKMVIAASTPTPRGLASDGHGASRTFGAVVPANTPPHNRVENGGVGAGGKEESRGSMTREEYARGKREARARTDEEMEIALWVEGVTGETFPGKFWSSLRDGVLLCKLANAFHEGVVPRINTARGAPFPEMENITSFLAACRSLGVPEHSLFDTKDLHEKRDVKAVVRCLQVLGTAVQTAAPDFRGPFLDKKSEAYFSRVNARGLRKQLGKGPGARGGIHALASRKVNGENVPAADGLGMGLAIENADPTVTITPAESPSGKRIVGAAPREASDSATGSGPLLVPPFSPRQAAATAATAAVASMGSGVRLHNDTGGYKDLFSNRPPVILEEEADHSGQDILEWVTTGGRREVLGAVKAGTGAEEGQAAGPDAGGGGSGERKRVRSRTAVDRGENVVSQVQSFVEVHSKVPWRVRGNMYESLRDGWQLGLLVNALRPHAVRRVHNSIQPAKHVQNIANFLISCRRMGVARSLLFEVDDLYANRSQTKVARTLLALRALTADPDFARARRTSIMGSSLLVAAAAAAGSTAPSEAPSSSATPGLLG